MTAGQARYRDRLPPGAKLLAKVGQARVYEYGSEYWLYDGERRLARVNSISSVNLWLSLMAAAATPDEAQRAA